MVLIKHEIPYITEKMEFRIVLHLSNFYHDYRRESRVFISKQFITIAELEQHIAKIFNIDNFYLSCQNYFLPPTEDIRILHEDDGVWCVVQAGPKNIK